MDVVARSRCVARVDVAQVGGAVVVCRGRLCLVHFVGRSVVILVVETLGGTFATNPQSRNLRFDTHRSWLSWRTVWLCFLAFSQRLCLCRVHLVGHSQSLLRPYHCLVGSSFSLFARLSRSALCRRCGLWSHFRRFSGIGRLSCFQVVSKNFHLNINDLLFIIEMLTFNFQFSTFNSFYVL